MLISGNLSFSLAVALSGVLIDVDHLIEYWLDTGLNVSVKKFFEYSQRGQFTRYVFIFHSFEFVLLLWVIGLSQGGVVSVWTGLALGVLCHIMLDFVNVTTQLRFKPRAILLYFALYRLCHKFNRSEIDRKLKRQSVS